MGIKEGEHGSQMYFLHRGLVEVLVDHETRQVAQLASGSVFGELALLGNGKRTSTVRALEVCDCRVINADAFHNALRRFPAERAYFYELAQQRCKEISKEAPKIPLCFKAPTFRDPVRASTAVGVTSSLSVSPRRRASSHTIVNNTYDANTFVSRARRRS